MKEIIYDISTGETTERAWTAEELAEIPVREQEAEVERQRLEDIRLKWEDGRARWRSSQLMGLSPTQVYNLIQNRLESATTAAEMKGVLVDLLPIIGAGLVALARQLED